MRNLSDSDVNVRIECLKDLAGRVKKGLTGPPRKAGHGVNNHIHTTYSFSPYSPSEAVWRAYMAGLVTAGLMDHDSVAGAPEFARAGEVLDMPTTVGLECRVDFSGTRLERKRINHPDQNTLAYVALHGVPQQAAKQVDAFFRPRRRERNRRNRIMTDRLNDFFRPCGVSVDFDRDVLPLSQYERGGSVTERHLLLAVSLELIRRFGRGSSLLKLLEQRFGDTITPDISARLGDGSNKYYAYDLIGLLKKDTSYFYADAGGECPHVERFVELARQTGSIPSYAYLGDVERSVTGDKKAQKFEDEYLDLLFDVLVEFGFCAVTYMPARNSLQQIKRVRELCGACGLFQICGEDVNSPRQPFVCEALKNREFSNLIDSAWALIGHQRLADRDPEGGMFSRKAAAKYPDLKERIEVFCNFAGHGAAPKGSPFSERIL